MIEFSAVTKEIRGLISRRQELGTFLGSVFAASGIFLQNALGGNLPESLASIEDHLFAYFALMLMVPSLIIALRVIRLHGGMTLNGTLYAHLMKDKDFTTPRTVEQAAAHNYVGASFLQFLLADVFAGFSATVMALSFGIHYVGALVVGIVMLVVLFLWYLRFHDRSAASARQRIAAETCEGFTRDDWEAHVSASLQDANRELIAGIGFVGLITFSVFEVMTGLGHIEPHHNLDLKIAQVRHFGPLAYSVLMLVTCVLGLVTYLRIRVAIGNFSLDLNPNDHPFRPFVLTDSLLGYLLLAFFLAISVHLILIQTLPGLGLSITIALDVFAVLAAVVGEQMTLIHHGKTSIKKRK